MLGDIVHNDEVVRDMERAGIRRIKRLGKGTNKTLVIPAHGRCLETIEKARTLGYKIIDATCPMVKEIHRIAVEKEQEGFRIIVIGDKKHDEVKAIVGQLERKAIVIDEFQNIPLTTLQKIGRAAVVVQSTQNLEKVLPIVAVLKECVAELTFFNTICRPTRVKQKEMKTMPLRNDVMIVIGSRTSANTKRLYEISKSLNKRTYWVQSKEEILPQWFAGAQKVGISAGASTPESTIGDVRRHIARITG
jgi:4-hydroxy-3-methylbut-2-enyl diphosphate reductase